MVGRLVLPLALTIGALPLLRRWMRPPSGSSEALRVVARTGLTRTAIIAIVAVGTRRFLLGASEAGVRMLQELDSVEPEDHPEPAGPTLSAINDNALQPLLDGDIEQDAAFEEASGPLRAFMLRQTDQQDLELMFSLTEREHRSARRTPRC